MKSFKNIKLILLFVVMIFLFSSCLKRIEDVNITTTVYVKETQPVTQSKVQIELEPTTTTEMVETESSSENYYDYVFTDEAESETTNEEVNIIETMTSDGSNVETIEQEDTSSEEYSNFTQVKFSSGTLPLDKQGLIDLDLWDYGMTPIEWIFVEPNKQLIANNRPNTSSNFSVKTKSSTGFNGCFVPVFTNCEAHGSDYEGRLYSFNDYSKIPIDEMQFKNSLRDMEYKGFKVKDILSHKYKFEELDNGVLRVNGEYINIVYADDLDSILNKLAFEGKEND